MQRYFVELSYMGTDFFGWQKQPDSISIQSSIEEALSKLHSNKEVKVVGCGRTDTGVHAKHFVLHVDLPESIDENHFVFKMNRMLPSSIAFIKAYKVDSDTHARFGAKQRTYRYYIHQNKDPFKTRQSWYVSQDLDLEKMNEAAKELLGTKDFTSLSKLHTDVKTNFCTVTEAKWVSNDQEIYFEITANRFLRNMVRATVGTLIDVGLGKIEVQDIQKILEAKDRQAASVSVPAHGLFLWKIEY